MFVLLTAKPLPYLSYIFHGLLRDFCADCRAGTRAGADQGGQTQESSNGKAIVHKTAGNESDH